MEPILVYGFPLGSSMGLVAAFETLGQPYRLSRVDMLADMKNDTYARLNPRQETPVLVTDKGDLLTETMAIAAWIEARDAERRISFAAGTPEADCMHQWIGFINSGFTGAFSPLWAALEMSPPEPDFQAALRRYGRQAVADRHAKLEAAIGDTSFLAGDRPTLADLVLIGVARWAEFHQAVDPAHYPRLAALRGRVEALPAVRFAMAIENGESPVGSGGMLGQVPLGEVIERFGPE
ncbi:glutathione S-transferase family protein [Sphingomonas sp. So64.6b]|uniref:glutathione S-transferase family protein n=1 Tax=Sphingomonas sp. So64.6b TaxID=2997354 RepID=UPI001601CCD1|nr:glutathione S-transferase family protein [Sphingomonas sp. So64.6b]QNA84895.1 glutathione S-transferase family protein [Sphingomonas sp. So64.6b]